MCSFFCAAPGAGLALPQKERFFYLPIQSNSETGYVSAEKTSPSPVSMVADVAAAIELEKQISASKGGVKSTLRDLLTRVASTYNKMTSIKRHRIDGTRKNLLYNMFLGWEF